MARVRGRRLRVAFDVRPQLGDRAELDRSVRQLGLDRSIGVKRIGHAVDDSRFENGGRARLRGSGMLLSAIFSGILCLTLSRLDCLRRSALGSLARARVRGPYGIEIPALGC